MVGIPTFLCCSSSAPDHRSRSSCRSRPGTASAASTGSSSSASRTTQTCSRSTSRSGRPSAQPHLAASSSCHRHALGMFFAVLLDKEIRGTRVLPERAVPAGRAVARHRRLHLAAHYSPDQGFINSVLGTTSTAPGDRLAGQPEHQPVGGPGRGELAPGRLRDGPLPGRPEGVRSEPARGRPDRRRQRAADVLPGRLPGAEPINIVVLVITVIESLRAFDLVYIINQGSTGWSCCPSW